jgi:hypothetical protein
MDPLLDELSLVELTPLNRALLGKLIVLHLDKKFPDFHRKQRFGQEI